MSARVEELAQRRVTVGRDWEAAHANGDLAGMDAAMNQIRAISRELRELAETQPVQRPPTIVAAG